MVNGTRGRNNRLFVIAGIVILLCALSITVTFAVTSKAPDVSIQGGQAEQVVYIGMKGAKYTPEIIRVEAGKPVTLRNDGTIAGCGMYIIQRDLGINANFAQSDSYTFTPTKKGTFRYTCSMGMYFGTIEVV